MARQFSRPGSPFWLQENDRYPRAKSGPYHQSTILRDIRRLNDRPPTSRGRRTAGERSVSRVRYSRVTCWIALRHSVRNSDRGEFCLERSLRKALRQGGQVHGAALTASHRVTRPYNLFLAVVDFTSGKVSLL